jgi:hypothetical protein
MNSFGTYKKKFKCLKNCQPIYIYKYVVLKILERSGKTKVLCSSVQVQGTSPRSDFSIGFEL